MVTDRPLTKIYLNIRSWSFSDLNSSVCVLQKYTLVERRLPRDDHRLKCFEEIRNAFICNCVNKSVWMLKHLLLLSPLPSKQDYWLGRSSNTWTTLFLVVVLDGGQHKWGFGWTTHRHVTSREVLNIHNCSKLLQSDKSG